MKQKTKNIIIAVVVIIIAFVGYKMIFPNQEAGEQALVAGTPIAPALIDGPKILALLDRMNQIDLEASIFTSPAFTGLISFEKPLQDQVSGRNNPFLPIGTDSSASSRGTSTATSTFR